MTLFHLVCIRLWACYTAPSTQPTLSMFKSCSILSIPGMLTTLLLLHHLGAPTTQGYPHAGEDPKMGILTHFILNYYSSDYKSRLVLLQMLQMLPLMMLCELNDIIFFIKAIF